MTITSANTIYKVAKTVKREKDYRLVSLHPVLEILDSKKFNGFFFNLNTQVSKIASLQTIVYEGNDTGPNWTLKVLYFGEEPIALIQRAGWDGEDHEEVFITNQHLFSLFISHIEHYRKKSTLIENNSINPNQMRSDLLEFSDKEFSIKEVQ